MHVGFVGLGRMGKHMVLRLKAQGFRVAVYNRSPEKVKQMEENGVSGAYSLKELVQKLDAPRVVWLMVPQGPTVDEMLDGIVPFLSQGDVVVDGGNSYYKDSVRRAAQLKAKGLHYLDVGTSGGLGGERHGYCFMAGGEPKAYAAVEPVLKVLAAPGGYGLFGPSGAGHFVKMVHNGIEYALLQSYGEGFELLKNAPEFKIDLHKTAHVWNRGSVIRSWLLELAEDALQKDGRLERIGDSVGGGSTGEWTVQTGIEQKTPTPMISTALNARYRTRQAESFAGKMVAALRNEFGGHDVVQTDAAAGVAVPANGSKAKKVKK
ncbi:decarboxylating 6-phosphogluconate dehydrogenase [Candidatus Micrarchaeota archaeon]|nr:decarboxylating 6-phosphogluconate dehydrogenase [Candidatus Micrarchaeota archaeon]